MSSNASLFTPNTEPPHLPSYPAFHTLSLFSQTLNIFASCCDIPVLRLHDQTILFLNTRQKQQSKISGWPSGWWPTCLTAKIWLLSAGTLLGGVDIQADPFNFKGCLRMKICF